MVGVASPLRRTFLSQFFTFQGRSNRANYWLSLLAIVIIYMFVLNVTLVVFSQSDALLDIHPTGVTIAFLNWGVAIVFVSLAAVRRLHDRDKSGHWFWLFYFVPAVLNIADVLLERWGYTTTHNLMLIVPAIALGVWGIVELGVLRGTKGANRFGPDPSAAAVDR